MSAEDAALRCIRVGDPWRVREIAEALEAAGITCRIDTYPPGAGPSPQRGGRSAGAATQMGVYVAPADAEAAAVAADAYERTRMPDPVRRGLRAVRRRRRSVRRGVRRLRRAARLNQPSRRIMRRRFSRRATPEPANSLCFSPDL